MSHAAGGEAFHGDRHDGAPDDPQLGLGPHTAVPQAKSSSDNDCNNWVRHAVEYARPHPAISGMNCQQKSGVT